MDARLVTLPELFLIAGTRGLLGAGIGLLLSNRLSEDQRRAVGWTLLGIGAITTIPLAAQVMGRRASMEWSRPAIPPTRAGAGAALPTTA